ncbi:hypothetical protein B0H14DRAFT_3865187 [Mycena olivaceomarginata]|nr:hypothetical protein B0H14DRAFT_3865187 [Mycena olivaceomarginata]
MTSVLEIQELCDYIVDFLYSSPRDLKHCALVSPSLVSSAQYHLFHEIQFGNGVKWNDGGACRRFCAIIKASPHLAPLVHRIRACFTPEVLGQLCEVELPNLRDLMLFRVLKDNLVTAVPEAALLVGFPSIRNIKLQDLVFAVIDDVGHLFQHCTPALDSIALSHIRVQSLASTLTAYSSPRIRLKIKALNFDSIMFNGGNWLLHHSLPFDLSALEELDLGGALSPSWLKILEQSRLSLRKLRIYAQDIINPKYTKNPIPATFIAQLPVLADLTIGSLGEELEDVETILEGLPPTNRLTRLTIDIMTRPREERLRPLGAACANMGCTVEVNLWRFMGAGLSPEDMAALVRAAFADLHERGRLVVRVRVDGGGV